eukprot:gene3723-7398_t
MLIKILNNEENVSEWCLLEFQGEIVGDSLAGCDLGTLTISEDGVSTEMEVGQHVLRGRVEKLHKAFVLVQKTKNNLEIKGYAKKKIIFNTRPQPRSAIVLKK